VKKALLLTLALAGCGTATSWLKDTADEINTAAFAGKINATVIFCDRHDNPVCWKHHGYYYTATAFSGPCIHIAPEWYWEPNLYFRGIIAHEMIHAWLVQRNESDPQKAHDWKFDQERERVAKALDIPMWAIPNGKREDKLTATQKMAWLEAYQQSQVDAVHGICHRETGGVGWPTQLYDPE
jgi:hypothetical protein